MASNIFPAPERAVTNSGLTELSSAIVQDAASQSASSLALAISGGDGSNLRILKTDNAGVLQVGNDAHHAADGATAGNKGTLIAAEHDPGGGGAKVAKFLQVDSNGKLETTATFSAGGTLNVDVTASVPVASKNNTGSASAGDLTFASNGNGSRLITVSDSAHGAAVGDEVTISGAASLGGNITASVLNSVHRIDQVVDANSYKIVASAAANNSDTGNGGSSAAGAYRYALRTQNGGPIQAINESGALVNLSTFSDGSRDRLNVDPGDMKAENASGDSTTLKCTSAGELKTQAVLMGTNSGADDALLTDGSGQLKVTGDFIAASKVNVNISSGEVGIKGQDSGSVVRSVKVNSDGELLVSAAGGVLATSSISFTLTNSATSSTHTTALATADKSHVDIYGTTSLSSSAVVIMGRDVQGSSSDASDYVVLAEVNPVVSGDFAGDFYVSLKDICVPFLRIVQKDTVNDGTTFTLSAKVSMR